MSAPTEFPRAAVLRRSQQFEENYSRRRRIFAWLLVVLALALLFIAFVFYVNRYKQGGSRIVQSIELRPRIKPVPTPTATPCDWLLVVYREQTLRREAVSVVPLRLGANRSREAGSSDLVKSETR